MQSQYLPRDENNNTRVLVEGPAWGDAEFYAHWLLNAAKAQALLAQAKKDDPNFRAAIDTLEVIHILDYGIIATLFLSKLVDSKSDLFVLDPDSLDLNDFAVMAEMGFFTLTGDRYQMTLPTKLDMDGVKQAHLRLAATEDEDWVHPERLLVDMPHARAIEFQRLLGDMDQDQRLADRRSLLFLD